MLCSVVSVQHLRQWDPRTREDCLALRLEEKTSVDICLIYRLVGFVSCIFKSGLYLNKILKIAYIFFWGGEF